MLYNYRILNKNMDLIWLFKLIKLINLLVMQVKDFIKNIKAELFELQENIVSIHISNLL
jgi:hypothetical protein